MNLSAYIAFRYPNWMDYARHQCRVQHLEGWECDLMNDIITDLMQKPEAKLTGLLQRQTKKIVNGEPTTDLDKFVLYMLKVNARSKFAAFRKNTVGQKIVTTGAIVEVAKFTELSTEADGPDECTYDAHRAAKLDRMHRQNIHRLTEAGYPATIIEKYKHYYIESRPAITKKDRAIIDSITLFLTTKQITLCLSK